MSDSSGARILVIDGGPESRASVAATLAGAGYRVETAASGEAALAALARAPDLVVLDPTTPCARQSRLGAALRDQPETRLAPVLALLPRGAAEEELPAGIECDDLLARPFAPALLLARVRWLVRGKRRCDEMAGELQRLTRVGLALSAEQDLQRLLERIVEEARRLNHADAATLYTVDAEAGVLRFAVMQNESMGIRRGGESGEPIDLPPVPLQPSSVSGYAALTGNLVNVADVYQAEGFDFSGPRRYDALTGYRSRSMLVVPIRGRDGAVIGVLQLINAQEPGTGSVIPFPARYVERTRALASQAGIALTNAGLIRDLRELFQSLIEVMATAIDEKSSYTAGHVRRVTDLAVRLAEAVNGCADGRFEGRRFAAEELEELRIAGMLHDIGKIVVPEHLVDKATKLECVFDRVELLRERFAAIRLSVENSFLREALSLARRGALPAELAALEASRDGAARLLEEELAFLERLNPGSEALSAESRERLEAIAAKSYRAADGTRRPYLTPDEARNLAIPRGTLLPEELATIREHAAVSVRLLRQIPFPRRLARVPEIAGDHHETLNGSGYPVGKSAPELCLRARILAVADVFDALTAADRPYKKAYPLEKALAILRAEAERGRLDARIVELLAAQETARARSA